MTQELTVMQAGLNNIQNSFMKNNSAASLYQIDQYKEYCGVEKGQMKNPCTKIIKAYMPENVLVLRGVTIQAGTEILSVDDKEYDAISFIELFGTYVPSTNSDGEENGNFVVKWPKTFAKIKFGKISDLYNKHWLEKWNNLPEENYNKTKESRKRLAKSMHLLPNLPNYEMKLSLKF